MLLNDSEAGVVSFEGQTRATLRVDVPQAALLDGANLVTLTAPGGEADVSLLDVVRLSYWRAYTAESDRLLCTAPGMSGVTIDGFSEPAIRVFDVTDGGARLVGKVTRGKEDMVSGYGRATGGLFP